MKATDLCKNLKQVREEHTDNLVKVLKAALKKKNRDGSSNSSKNGSSAGDEDGGVGVDAQEEADKELL